MGNLAYLTNSDNKLVGSTITPSSAASAYPIANLTGLPISKPFRFTGDTSENLQIDLGSALPIDLIALVNHNLTSAATITVNAGASANPDGSTYTTTVTWRARDAFKLLSSPQTYRYWKIIIADSANTDTFIELGFAMLGDSTTLGFNYRYGGTFIDEQNNLEVETEFGSPHVVELHDRVRLSLPFNNIQASEAVTLRTLYRTLKRNLVPLFLIPDAAVNDGYFGRWVSQYERQDDFYRSVTVEFLQDGKGDRIAA